MADVNEVVAFTSMAEGAREDYELLERLEAKFAAQTADRVLEMLRGLTGWSIQSLGWMERLADYTAKVNLNLNILVFFQLGGHKAIVRSTLFGLMVAL